jgi:hypothetical protein
MLTESTSRAAASGDSVGRELAGSGLLVDGSYSGRCDEGDGARENLQRKMRNE